MNCPVCDSVKMREVQKEDILIDVCPSCKGVWLDRGELDKLMSGVREVREPFNQWYGDQDDDHRQPMDYRNNQGYNQPKYEDHKSYDYSKSHDGYRKKKKKSVMDVLGDLFD